MTKLRNPLIISVFFISIFFHSTSSASPNYYCSSVGFRDFQTTGEIEEIEPQEKIEAYLQETVPGLSATYREVIDALIEEGHHVYLTGGVVRDLLSLSSARPNDVDLDYSGTVEELIAILDKKGWMYTRLPNHSLVIVGDHRAGSIDAMPIRKKNKQANEYSLEFTINNIFYHCNSRAFTPDSKKGLEDLRYDRINIAAKNWKAWLYQPQGHRYYKVFRFWKMIGKGYLYSEKLAGFFHGEIDHIMIRDPEGFNQEMLIYLSNHMDSYHEIYRGCIAVMGYDWATRNFSILKAEAELLQEEFQARKDHYTHNLPRGNDRGWVHGPSLPLVPFGLRH